MKFLSTLPALLLLTALASAQRPGVDLSGVDEALSVPPTEILTLGSMHLSAYRETLEPSAFDELRGKLIAYAPDVVTIEGVPGMTCEQLLAYPEVFADAGDTYCYDVAPFREESGLTMATAMAAVTTALRDWPATPAPADRRGLAAGFLGANDRYSALVQWLRLPEGERHAGNGLGEASVAYLEKLAGSLNESTQLGARVAAALGHERVFPADDHSADEVLALGSDSLWVDMRAIWRSPSPLVDPDTESEYMRLDSGFTQAGGILPLYRAINSPRFARMFLGGDFRKAMNEPGSGRRYLTWYQVRNLRMVAHVMAAAAHAPGGKVLNIVGASHKPYFDAYLDQMHDVRLGDAEAVLR